MHSAKVRATQVLLFCFLLLCFLLPARAVGQSGEYRGTVVNSGLPGSPATLTITISTDDGRRLTGYVDIGSPLGGSGPFLGRRSRDTLYLTTTSATGDTILWVSPVIGRYIGGTYRILGGQYRSQSGVWSAEYRAVPATPTVPQLEGQERATPISFARGDTSATVEDAVVRGSRDRYVVAARAGQAMRVTITSVEDNAVFQIVGPDGRQLPGAEEMRDATSWQGALPLTGGYVIVVGGTRGNATYRLTVSIPPQATDLSGTWDFAAPPEDPLISGTFTLRRSGTRYSGELNISGEAPVALRELRISRDTVTMVFGSPSGGQYTFTAVVSADRREMSMTQLPESPRVVFHARRR